MTKTADQIRAETRAHSTDEERKVLALEALADHLRLLIEVMRPASKPMDGSLDQAGDRDIGAAGAWENEGGSLAASPLNSLGITHSVIDQFEIGGYRYSKLEDAVAEAKRTQAKD